MAKRKLKSLSSRELIKVLEADGWVLARVQGTSHHIFQHPTKPGSIPVSHPRKTMAKGTQRKILKLAGLL
jgi:predicted RNA binding protein YcfA (HicA-like mRNA interferase family)